MFRSLAPYLAPRSYSVWVNHALCWAFQTLLGVFPKETLSCVSCLSWVWHTFWCVFSQRCALSYILMYNKGHCFQNTPYQVYKTIILQLNKLFAQNIRSDSQMVYWPFTNNYFHTKFSNNCTYNDFRAFWYEMAFYHTKHCLVVTNCLKRQKNEQFLFRLNCLYLDNLHWGK